MIDVTGVHLTVSLPLIWLKWILNKFNIPYLSIDQFINLARCFISESEAFKTRFDCRAEGLFYRLKHKDEVVIKPGKPVCNQVTKLVQSAA